MQNKKKVRKESLRKSLPLKEVSRPTGENSLSASSGGEHLVYDQEGMPPLEVLLEGETIWLTQKQMAELFGCSAENIRLHVRNIYDIGELEEVATSKEFLEVRIEGSRRVARKFAYYQGGSAVSATVQDLRAVLS